MFYELHYSMKNLLLDSLVIYILLQIIVYNNIAYFIVLLCFYLCGLFLTFG